ncbi:hypothetical protein BJ999_000714 [Actinomadura citrea]|uniref:HTH luxR-type domain-containing protein n=1 Tax=Actinomadura citrea TaxID=46158 RepID=A0A7Y9KBX2_9ACTN|nr:hypothetical protein [Actinomadura citrea]
MKTHPLHLYRKLGVRDRASAVAAAYERGLLGYPITTCSRGRCETGWFTRMLACAKIKRSRTTVC